MIDNYHPDLVISSGVAGGADINLNVTEVVVATKDVYKRQEQIYDFILKHARNS